MSQADTLVSDYDILTDLIRTRTSMRELKPDPIPDDSVRKVLEARRWAMSGANGQPWDFIVVKDAVIKKELFRAYAEVNQEFIYWMEQQRDFKLRHPAYQMTHRDTVQRQRTQVGWSEAPVLIVITGDGRRQWATVQGTHTFGRDQSHLTDGLTNASMLMHLAAALGPGSQHVTIHIEEPFKSYRGAIPAHSRRALAPGADHADRLAGGGAQAGRAPAVCRHGTQGALRHEQIHVERARDGVPARAARGHAPGLQPFLHGRGQSGRAEALRP
jgi:nitroreductase